jgi:hypothetical protein
MRPDQVNTVGWDRGWTNLVNDVEQTFTPSLPKLMGVEVELVVGNAGAAKDQLTLTVLEATGKTVVVVTENVQTADCDHVMFVIPKGGLEITPGQSERTIGHRIATAGMCSKESGMESNRTFIRPVLHGECEPGCRLKSIPFVVGAGVGCDRRRIDLIGVDNIPRIHGVRFLAVGAGKQLKLHDQGSAVFAAHSARNVPPARPRR